MHINRTMKSITSTFFAAILCFVAVKGKPLSTSKHYKQSIDNSKNDAKFRDDLIAIQYLCGVFGKITNFSIKTNFTNPELFNKWSEFLRKICHFSSNLKNLKNMQMPKLNAFLQFVSSAKTIEMFEEIANTLFDNQNKQLIINLEFLGVKGDTNRVREFIRSVGEDFGLTFNHEPFPTFEEACKEIETHLNLLKNGAETVNGILLRVVAQIIKILSKSRKQFYVTGNNFDERKREIKIDENDLIEGIQKTGYLNEESKYSSNPSKTLIFKQFLDGNIYFENDPIHRVRRFNRRRLLLNHIPFVIFVLGITVGFILRRPVTIARIVAAILLVVISVVLSILNVDLERRLIQQREQGQVILNELQQRIHAANAINRNLSDIQALTEQMNAVLHLQHTETEVRRLIEQSTCPLDFQSFHAHSQNTAG